MSSAPGSSQQVSDKLESLACNYDPAALAEELKTAREDLEAHKEYLAAVTERLVEIEGLTFRPQIVVRGGHFGAGIPVLYNIFVRELPDGPSLPTWAVLPGGRRKVFNGLGEKKLARVYLDELLKIYPGAEIVHDGNWRPDQMLAPLQEIAHG